MIAFADSTPPPRNHRHVIGLLATASVRIREAVDWLEKQQQSDDRHLVESYHHIARRDVLEAVELAQQVAFVLQHCR